MKTRNLKMVLVLAGALAFAACGDDKDKKEAEPDAAGDAGDTGGGDATQPEADAAQPEADTAQPEADTAQPEADTAQPEADTAQPEADVPQPEPAADADAAQPEADADPEPTWPEMPGLGTQIDRMGRPAINTALNATFNGDKDAKGAAKDAYNQAGPADWGTFTTEFATNLAILDAIDGTCGNQLAYDFLPAPSNAYNALAFVLASDDRLYIDSESPACVAFLGVEAETLGLLGPDGEGGCGGRTLDYDVIETYYSALAAGLLAGVDDGIAADDVEHVQGFPYLGAPAP